MIQRSKARDVVASMNLPRGARGQAGSDFVFKV
jgi:hypothetical protein